MNKTIIEVASAHLESALKAAHLGADRLELCSALPLGGLTPHDTTVQLIKKESAIPIVALIRPREGHFRYSENEKTQTYRQIESSLKHGADQIAVGALDDNLKIDHNFIKQIRNEFPATPICFHRAFDFTPDPFESMNTLIDLNIQRILTSGQHKTAFDGHLIIKKLVSHANQKIEILPGAGINHRNARQLINLTNCTAIHLSAKKCSYKSPEDAIFNTDLWDLDEDVLKATIQSFY